jgi:hypothetical protein
MLPSPAVRGRAGWGPENAYMLGQLCVVPGEAPGVDGEAPVDGLVSGAGLAEGEVAACAIAYEPNPLPNARLMAIAALVSPLRGHASFCIA